MALAALISAYHEAGEAGLLRAVLPIAGRTVIERQARLAAAAGATRIIILVECMPAELSAAIERLRRDRVPVQIAREAADAAEAIDAADRLLLIGDGAIVDDGQLRRLAAGEGHAVLTVADGAYGELYERIDGQSRWGGAAAIDGALLRATVAMLRDWDLQSTLLRRALQGGARQLAADTPVAILDRTSDSAALESRILANALETRGGWIDYLLGPLERAAAGLLVGTSASPVAVGAGGAVLSALGAGAFAMGWNWTGLAAMLLASPLEGVALRLSRARLQGDARRSWWRALLPALAGGGLVALGLSLAAPFGWGMTLLAFMTIAFLLAQEIEARGREISGRWLLAEPKGMIWLMLPFAGFGAWQSGLAALFAYAVGSFFWAQRQAHQKGTGGTQD